MIRKRNKTDIIHDMLKLIQDNNGKIKKTHLMYKANLSHKQMEGYLEELQKNSLIEKDDSNKTFTIHLTKKGNDFLLKYSQIKEFERAFGL